MSLLQKYISPCCGEKLVQVLSPDHHSMFRCSGCHADWVMKTYLGETTKQ